MNRIQSRDHRYERLKSTRFICLVLMIKQWIWWIRTWLLELIIKNSYLNNYSEKLFCQVNCFNFASSQNSLFVKKLFNFQFYQDSFFVILNLKNVKHLRKELNEELMSVACIPKDEGICVSEDEKKKEMKPIFTEGL